MSRHSVARSHRRLLGLLLLWPLALPAAAQQPGAPQLQVSQPALAETVQFLSHTLPPDVWSCSSVPWTSAMFRQVGTALGVQERAEKILAQWKDAASLEWTDRKNPRRMAALGVVQFAEASAARAYLGLAIDLQRKQDELLAGRVQESRCLSVRLPGCEEAVRQDKKVLLPGGGPTSVSMLFVRSGALVLQFTWHNVEPNQAWAEKVFTAISTSLGGQQKSPSPGQ